ncbi:MAG: hypothetical protein PsegKO_12550 [Pseudohongiellaceae bacterium]
MGEVVRLDQFRTQQINEFAADSSDSLIPVEFAVGKSDRQDCLDTIAEYGIRQVISQKLAAHPGADLKLIGVRDAIWLNKKILEREEMSDDEIARRIDLIQMLENTNLALLESLWQSFTRTAPETH